MSYLEGFLYNHTSGKMEETRQGVAISRGRPQDLPEWKFKVELKIKIVEQINDQGRKAEQMGS